MKFIQDESEVYTAWYVVWLGWVGLGWVRLGLCSELVVVPLIAREKGVGSCALELGLVSQTIAN